MSTIQWFTLSLAGIALFTVGCWFLNGLLKPPRDLPIHLGAEFGATRHDVFAWACAAIVFGSCSTCTVVEIRARERAYAACVSAHSAEDCREARP